MVDKDLAIISKEFASLQNYVIAKQMKRSEGIKKDMYIATTAVMSEAQKVIRDYNKGKIERYPGDLAERTYRNYKNNPLKDTGVMANSIGIEVKKTTNPMGESTVTGKVIFNAWYARMLNDGTKYIAPYRFREIAMVMAEDKVKKIMGVG